MKPNFLLVSKWFLPFLKQFLSYNFLLSKKIESICRRTINVTEKLKFTLARVENIVGKGENAGHTMFSKGILYGVTKNHDYVLKS